MMASTHSFSFVFDDRPLDVSRLGDAGREVSAAAGEEWWNNVSRR
jgi:hypothetical protein